MLKLMTRPSSIAHAWRWTTCTVRLNHTALSPEAYHKIADATLEGVLEVYEDVADDSPQLAMDVEYSVRPHADVTAHVSTC